MPKYSHKLYTIPWRNYPHMQGLLSFQICVDNPLEKDIEDRIGDILIYHIKIQLNKINITSQKAA